MEDIPHATEEETSEWCKQIFREKVRYTGFFDPYGYTLNLVVCLLYHLTMCSGISLKRTPLGP